MKTTASRTIFSGVASGRRAVFKRLKGAQPRCIRVDKTASAKAPSPTPKPKSMPIRNDARGSMRASTTAAMRAIAAANPVAPGEALRNLRSNAPIAATFDPSAGKRLSKRGQVDRSESVDPGFGLPSGS